MTTDRGVYSHPWTTSNSSYWRPTLELLEYVCQENEKISAHIVGK